MDELRPSQLSRADLQAFLGNNERLIRFFENLIKIAAGTPDGIDVVTVIANTAQDTADGAASTAGFAAVLAQIALDLARTVDDGHLPAQAPALQAQLDALAVRVAALEEGPTP